MTSGPIPSPGMIAMSGMAAATLPWRAMTRSRRFVGHDLVSRAATALAFAATIACGSPAADGPGASSPAGSGASSSRGGGAQAASSSPDASAATGSAPAGPSDAQGWPFAPAPSAEERAAQLTRLANDPGPLKSNWTPPGKSARYGHAEGLIAAPYDAVRARLVDFGHYKDLAGPKFKKVSLVDKQAGGTDIYWQLPIMKGVVTIWYVTRFAPARPAAGGGEVVEGTFVKGNIKDVHLVFTMRPAAEDKAKTVLVCDLLLALNIPAPQGALDEELRDACGDAINNVRAKSTAAP